MLSPKSLLPAILLSCTHGTASAQDEPASEPVERIVTTATRQPDPTSSLPFVVASVDSESLKMTSPEHIEEVLKFIAGVGVQRGNGQEYLPAIRSQVFTGAGACGGLLTAEDGIPLRAAGFCNINELFEAHAEMAQRIEVLKGPGSALYGSNAVHGVINVITPDTTQGPGLLGMDYGSYGYTRFKLRNGVDWGDGGLGVNASITRDSGYRDGERVDQEKVNVRHRLDAGQVQVTSGLTYTNLDQQTAGYITGQDAYKDDDRAQQNENPDAFRRARALRVWSKLRIDLGQERVLTLTPYARDQEMDFFMHFLPGTPLETNAQQGVGFQSLYTAPLGDNWLLRTGVDAEYTQGSLTQFQEDPTEGSAFLQETIPAGDHYDYDVDARLLAPFVSLVWQQQKWRVSIGARYEDMRYDYTNNMLTGRTRDDGTPCGMGGCRYARPGDRVDNFTNVSPKLGVTYQWSPDVQLYANLSAGYRAPQATELYRLQREQQVAELDEVTIRSAETGLRAAVPAGRVVLSLYRMDKDNFIYRDANFFNVSNGESRHEGVELTWQYQFSPAFDIRMAASYARHTYRHTPAEGETSLQGNDIDSAPRTLTNTRLGWNLSDQSRLELEWQHVGSYYTDPENLHEYEGHDVLHLRGKTQLTPALELSARILNIADINYAERADFTQFGGARYFPGMPRHVMMSLNYQW
ncbi:TonB-dependent receptor [Alteromonas halophila]|uniref:TonB-dependent receptor n=1 Tax=Alteromonas halophila TaxID=516698 RepID=A0A918MVC3_9ALTE|nr:TonB-dependent receptor [Alteromonas halophila]GGW77999.1 TonB-dependent receptor [Alteromonas halophila]